jgi:hypothetical protein
MPPARFLPQAQVLLGALSVAGSLASLLTLAWLGITLTSPVEVSGVETEAPSYGAAMCAFNGATLLLGAAGAVGGAWLWARQPGARALNVVWAALFGLLALAQVAYDLGVLLPATLRLLDARPVHRHERMLLAVLGAAAYWALALAYSAWVVVLVGTRPAPSWPAGRPGPAGAWGGDHGGDEPLPLPDDRFRE